MAKKPKKSAKDIRKERIDRYIDEALSVLGTAQDRVEDARTHGVAVDTTHIDFEETRKRLLEAKQGKRKLSEGYLKEAAGETYYDTLIKYSFPVYVEEKEVYGKSGKEKAIVYAAAKDSTGAAIPNMVTISQYDINTIRNKELKGKNLDKLERVLLNQWNEATYTANQFKNYKNDALLGITPTSPEDIKRIKKGFVKSLDLTVGGHSSLINDLAYSISTYGPHGKEIINSVRDLMRNPKTFAYVEKWYNTTDEGQKCRDALNAAKGQAWYKKFNEAAASILELFYKLDEELNLKVDDSVKEYLEAVVANNVDLGE